MNNEFQCRRRLLLQNNCPLVDADRDAAMYSDDLVRSGIFLANK